MDIRDYIKILKRQKLIISVSAILIFVSYVFMLFRQPSYYEARATIMLTEVSLQERILRSLSTVTPQSVSMNSQLQLMYSRKFAKRVAEKISRRDKGKNPAAVRPETVLQSVNISKVGDTNLIEIIARSPDKGFAIAVAEAYAGVSVEENNRIAGVEFDNAKKFVETQLGHAYTRLKKAQKALHEFNERMGVVDFDQALNGQLEKISNYQASVEQIKTEEQQKQFLVVQLREKLKNTPNVTQTESIIPNQLQEEMQSKLFTLEMELLDLKDKYTEAHPKVMALRNKLDQINQTMKKNVSRFVSVPTYTSNPIYYYTYQQLAQEEVDLMGLNVKKAAVASMLNRSQKGMPALSKKQLDYAQLSQEQKTSERIYQNLLDMHEQMKVSQATRLGNAQSVDIPDTALRVSKASFQSIFVMVFFSILCGLGCGVVVELLDDVMRSPHVVRRVLNMPVLGTIPKITSPGSALLLDGNRKSPLEEAYHKVAYQVQSVCFDLGAKALLLTSSRAEEGKSTVISNLGISLAMSGESILLVDGDIRRPTLHRLFRLDNTVGLSNILAGEFEQKGLDIPSSVDAVLKQVGVERLFLLPAGPAVANPVELLRSSKMQEVVTYLKQKASLVLMDSSPLVAVIDPVIEASYLDGVVFIVDSSKTRRNEATHSKQLLTSLKLRVMGVILNQVMVDEEDYYYYYYYSSYGPRHKKSK